MADFKLTRRQLRPDCSEIDIEGELDLAVADDLREAIEGTDGAQVLIRLQDCEFIDSTGLAVIVEAHNRLAKEGRRLALLAPQGQVERVLELTGLSSNGLVFETAEIARETRAKAKD